VDEERLRNPLHWTTSDVLSFQARTQPDKIAVQFLEGGAHTYADIWLRTRAVAAGLAAHGIQAGDKIAVLLSNGLEYCETWWGSHLAGCVLVPVNTELVGKLLANVLNLSEARMIVVEADYLPRLEAIRDQLPSLEFVVTVGSGPESADGLPWQLLAFESLRGAPDRAPAPQAKFSDLACLMFTSGTTGPSKAVMMPHAHLYLFGLVTLDTLDLTGEDTYYVTLPLFHANGMLLQTYACLIAGAKAVIRKKFSASNWIRDISECRATHTNFLGVMAEFIDQQPSSAFDTNHELRVICAAPAAPKYVERFKKRFGVGMTEGYGMSEVNTPLMSPLQGAVPGSCGKVYDRYFEVRIADPETDLELPPDTPGEIQVRPKQAFGFMTGYYRQPGKTVEAWRNLWFHTGDLGRMDSDRNFYFIDRLKDCIRRRGENVSAYEVETVLMDYPLVTDAAAVAIASEIDGGEDEILAVLVTENELDPFDLLDHCWKNLPKYAVPRFFRFITADEMPRTATNKIRKSELREIGVSGNTWTATQEQPPARDTGTA